MNPPRLVRLAIAGTGFGASVHLPVFRMIPGVEVVALIGNRLDKTRRIADEQQIPLALSGYDSLARLDVDAVSIALPPHLSGSAIRLAQQNNLHILAEKPLTVDPHELLSIVSSLTDRVQIIDYLFLELEAFRYLRDMLRQDACGTIQHVQIRWLVHSYAERHRLRSWKRNALLGGGVLNLLGSHLCCYVPWLFGPVAAVYRRAQTVAPDPPDDFFAPAEHTVELVFEMAARFPIFVTLSNACPGDPLHSIEVIGSQATIRLTNHSQDYVRGFACEVVDQTQTACTEFLEDGPWQDGRQAVFYRLASRFIAAILDPAQRAAASPGFETEVGVQRVLQAIRTGGRIVLPKAG